MRDTPMGDDDDENYYDSEGNLIQRASDDHGEVYVPEPKVPDSEETRVQYIEDDDDETDDANNLKISIDDSSDDEIPKQMTNDRDSDSDIEFLCFEPSTNVNKTRTRIKEENNPESSQTEHNTS